MRPRVVLELFPSVLDQPGADVDRLDVVLDNVADTGDAAGKGALTRLTFGAPPFLRTRWLVPPPSL